MDYNNHYPVKEKLKSLTLINYRTQTLIAT
ncbi:hypothetical protein [Photorhabdus aballayi]